MVRFLLIALGVFAGAALVQAQAQAQDTPATVAGKPWTESAVAEMMATYAERDRNYRNSILQEGWKPVDCSATPYKDVVQRAGGEKPVCFDGPLYQVNQGCKVKQFMAAVSTATEEALVSGNYPTESRCGMFTAAPKRDTSFILFPVKILRPFDDNTDAALLGNAHALTFTSEARPCLGFRDYGTPSFSGVYAYTSTAHVCRKAAGAAYGQDDLKRWIATLQPNLNW